MDLGNKIIIGNFVLHPATLRNFLLKSHYFLIYTPDSEKLTLNANHGNGGEVIFEARNVSYEAAAKIADELGLEGAGDQPTIWSKWNPIYWLDHDGTEDAEKIRAELARLNIPHRVSYGAEKLCLSDGQFVYMEPFYNAEAVLLVIRKAAELYAKNLATKP